MMANGIRPPVAPLMPTTPTPSRLAHNNSASGASQQQQDYSTLLTSIQQFVTAINNTTRDIKAVFPSS